MADVQVGQVVAIKGRQVTHRRNLCPQCGSMWSAAAMCCPRCHAQFVPVTDGYVQVVRRGRT